MTHSYDAFSKVSRTVAVFLMLVVVTACAKAPAGGGVNDPYEVGNRKVHAFNRGVDQALLRPTSNVYGSVVPVIVQESVSNFSDNVGLGGTIVNNVLQADLVSAASNTLRFVINTTAGIGGLFDPSTAMGLNEVSADFGGTLHTWGAREGAYLELPFLGASTQRDTAGTIVDFALNPLSYVIKSPDSRIVTGARVGSALGSRYKFSDTVDSVLYDSADSYAQLRLIYLQRRRFELGAEAEDDYFDPYEDPYEN